MIKLRSAALGVAGVFLSAAVIAAVLALALWDFKSHNTQKNVLYGGKSNSISFYCLITIENIIRIQTSRRLSIY